MNPIAAIADIGYVQENRRLLEGDMRLTQDLSMFVKGLNAEVAVAYDNSATFQDIGSKTYLYEMFNQSATGLPSSETGGANSTMQISSSKLTAQFIRASVEAKLNYDRTIQEIIKFQLLSFIARIWKNLWKRIVHTIVKM